MKRKMELLSSKEKLKPKKPSSEIVENILNDLNSSLKPTSSPLSETEKEKLNEEKKENVFIWRTFETSVLCKAYNEFKPGSNLVCFDLDDTLIKMTKSEPKNKKKEESKIPNTNKSTSPELIFDIKIIKSMLEKYFTLNYVFAVFSNQNGISLGYITENEFKSKIDKLFTEIIKYPFVFICAKEKDYYRKPCIGMLEIFESKFNQNIKLNLSECLYVGDAAGRKKNNKRKKNDFSNSDLKFAINCGFKFMTPEHFFLNENDSKDIPEIKNFLLNYEKNNNNHIKFQLPIEIKNEVIILIGPPGGGKSVFCEEILSKKGYIRINQDNLKSKDKVKKALIENLNNKKNIVIDCTNGIKNKREELIDICKEYKNIQIRAFVMQINKELAFHLNNLRSINKFRKHHSGSVPNMPIHSFFKYYEEPILSEGFKEIVKVNFVPGPFNDEKDKKVFYLLS